MNALLENLPTLLGAVVVVALVGGATVHLRRQKKSGCGCGCDSCPNAGVCHK